MVKSDQLPYFVTLTYPDQYLPEPKSWKRDMATFVKRLRREHSEACGFWKMELKVRQSGAYQGRIAPHFHLLVWGVPESWETRSGQTAFLFQVQANLDCENGKRLLRKEVWNLQGQQWVLKSHREIVTGPLWKAGQLEGKLQDDPTGRYVRIIKEREGKKVVEIWERDGIPHLDQLLAKSGQGQDYVSIKEWVSLAWYQVVGSGEHDHLRAGTRVERIRSPQGVFWYASKYVAKIDTEQVPGVGRFWGLFNAAQLPWAEIVSVEFTRDQAVRLLRIARRYVNRPGGRHFKFRAGLGMSIFCDAKWWRSRVVPWVVAKSPSLQTVVSGK